MYVHGMVDVPVPQCKCRPYAFKAMIGRFIRFHSVSRYSAVITPVINYVIEVLPEASRDTKPMELAYEDLEKLSGEKIMRICEWLTDKVLSLLAVLTQYVHPVYPAEDP